MNESSPEVAPEAPSNPETGTEDPGTATPGTEVLGQVQESVGDCEDTPRWLTYLYAGYLAWGAAYLGLYLFGG